MLTASPLRRDIPAQGTLPCRPPYCLWHTLLLPKWDPIFVWCSAEAIICANQREYYAAINTSNNVGESTAFIAFMLSAIKASLIEVVDVSDEMSDGVREKAVIR